MNLLQTIWSYAHTCPNATAIEILEGNGCDQVQVTYAQLTRSIATVGLGLEFLRGQQPEAPCVGVIAANSSEWIVADLALQLCGYTEVPVPLGFSYEQAQSMLHGASLALVDSAGTKALANWQSRGLVLECQPRVIEPVAADSTPQAQVDAFWRQRLAHLNIDPDFIAKVIHTSGTTSNPKGVRIRASALDIQTRALSELVGSRSASRYVSLVPLSLLIEQLCAVHLPLVNCGTIVLLPADVQPFTGGGARAANYLKYIAQAAPTLLMVPPAIIEAIAHARRDLYSRGLAGDERNIALFGNSEVPLITCGGAPVSSAVLDELFANDIPVYEGYGLSENTAVACWNCPGQFRRGTVGRALPHIETCLSEKGELLLRGPTIFAGYHGTDPTCVRVSDDGWLHTGDLATIDDGYITLHGRCKNVIISAASRNLSPEWVEGVYREHPAVREIVVFGDNLERLVALVISDRSVFDSQMLRRALDETAERRLPDYAQVAWFVALRHDDPVLSDLFTVTGRPRRDLIWQMLVSRSERSVAAE
jgi:long-subunit acyl-CoA synthetase (AMP-forming)